jgi:(1->4)-alpha-D-glucan 1-alpha-D-glucosylmutase
VKPSRRGRLGPTYRLQLRPGFGFEEAAQVAGYLAGLGVELAYLSPIAEAVPGSVHGYDGTEPTAVRAELGGRAGLDRLVAELHRNGLGILLDIVPNHLATWPSGPWWGDVLRNGRESRYAAVFDIDWGAAGDRTDRGGAPGRGHVVLPILGAPLDEVLSAGELTIELSAGSPVLRYGKGGPLLPLADGTGQPGDDVAAVLGRQHYRLCHWRDRRARNYRRFFDIDDLVGVRVEDPAVFELTHRLVAELVEAGAVDGLRVDHVDGLADPAAYLRRLHELSGGLPVIVEKILTGDEPLRLEWPVDGTTGYESADDISGALVDAAGLRRLVGGARAEGEHRVADVVADGKILAAEETFAAEREQVAGLLGADAEELTRALVDLPVYRTYVSSDGASALDTDIISALSPATLAGRLLSSGEGAVRFQQLSGPVMAKGVEDTAWYRLVGPLPFLEVGGDPGRDRADGLARLHSRSIARVASGYGGLVAGTTHDTKRSADSRARLLAIAEVVPEFEAGLIRFAELVPLHKTGTGKLVGSALELRLIAATLLAVVPAGGEAEWAELPERVGQALRKAAREAKVHSSWTDPDEEYEEALIAIANKSLAREGAVLYEAFGDLVEEVASLGATISLAQVVLRSFLPGVPDCYQGDESWNFSLVDPDNRRPVPFGRLESELALIGDTPSPESAAALRAAWRNGLLKLHVTRQCLRARALVPGAVKVGAAYVPLRATGAQAGHVVSFCRLGDGDDLAQVIVVASKMPRGLMASPDDLPAGRRAWGSTALELPEPLAGAPGGEGTRVPGAAPPGSTRSRWFDVCAGRHVMAQAGRLDLATVLADLPVAVLVRTEGGPSAGPPSIDPRR